MPDYEILGEAPDVPEDILPPPTIPPATTPPTTTPPTTVYRCEPDNYRVTQLQNDLRAYETRYQADRGLATYEGRYDDAKQMELEMSQVQNDYSSALDALNHCQYAAWYF